MTDTRPLSERLAEIADLPSIGINLTLERRTAIAEAVKLAKRVEAAPVVVARDHEGAMPGDLIYVGKRLPLSWVGKRVALVEVGE